MKDLLTQTLQSTLHYALRYDETRDKRPVYPADEAVNALARFDEPLPDSPCDPQAVVQLLDEIGSPATVTMTGGRYFGFVTGSSLPATVAANWLASVWDQNAASAIMSPTAAKLEQVALGWVLDVLGFEPHFAGGFVTGATMANFTGLAAARHAILKKSGWDVEKQGLYGAPEIKVVVGDEVHASLLIALSYLGLGRERVIRVPADAQGRMRADQLPELDEHTIVCIQAGNVTSGAFDPAEEICRIAHKAGAWVHVDGAFGLWALASPEKAPLAKGIEQADSWATDAHKWLNVPYDSGIVLCRQPEALHNAMSIGAPYLIEQDVREPYHYTPEMSRRARGVEIWAALKSLGRSGLAEMIDGCCHHACTLAEGLQAAGYTVHNDVVLNQVFVSFGDEAKTRRVIEAIHRDGTLWAGSSTWHGQFGLRMSVSSWATTDADIEKSLAAILRIAKEA